MPRKSAAALSLAAPRGRGLSSRRPVSPSRRAGGVRDAVRSVKPGHFALEDVPLLVAYASATVQERAISGELETAETETGKDKLRPPMGALREVSCGWRERSASGPWRGRRRRHRRRLQTTVEASGAPPWEYEPDESSIDAGRAQYPLVRGSPPLAGRTLRRPAARHGRVHAGRFPGDL